MLEFISSGWSDSVLGEAWLGLFGRGESVCSADPLARQRKSRYAFLAQSESFSNSMSHKGSDINEW
jgi:hypothetical protein